MKIETENRDDHQVTLTAELEADQLDQFMQRAARKISRESKIPGFRPGKAPFDVVKRLYGMEMIEKQAVELLVDDVYPKLLDEAKIDPSGPGTLQEIVSINPPKFVFLVPLTPEVHLGDYRAIREAYQPKPVTEEEVDQTLRNLQRRYATAEPVDRAAQSGDLVYLKINARFTQPLEGEDEELIKETPFQVIIGDENQSESDWPFPGFSEHLIGLAANNEKTITHTFSEDNPLENLANRTVDFRVFIQSVKSLALPELNDDFAQTLGEFESLAAVRKTIRKNLENAERMDCEEEYFDKLIDRIMADTTIKYPPHMLEEELEKYLRQVEKSLAQQKMDLDTYLKTRQLELEKYIAMEARPAAARNLERSLVLQELARLEDIKVDNQELKEAVGKRIGEMGEMLKKKEFRTERGMRNLTEMLTYDTASRMFYHNLMKRLKAIATDTLQTEEVRGESESSESKENAPKPNRAKKAAKPPAAAREAKAATSPKTAAAATKKTTKKTSVRQSADQEK